jgi:hypothetical protein
MSEEDVDKMQAGPALDALVGEKVMGWKLINLGRRKYDYASTDEDRRAALSGRGVFEWHWEGKDAPDDGFAHEWNPSTDIAAAWQVVEKLHEPDTTDFSLNSATVGWRARFGYVFKAFGDTAPLAICRAALKSSLASPAGGKKRP